MAGGGQQQRKPLARAKVPPPSKIPASAVEMPGDMGGYLDVQFGMDFGSEETFDQLSDRFGAATIDAQGVGNVGPGQQQQVDQDAYQQQQQQVKAAGADQLVGGYVSASGQRVVNQGSVQQQQQSNNSGAPAGYPSAIVSQYGAAAGGNVSAGQVQGGNKNIRSQYSNQAPGVVNNSYVSNATSGGGYGATGAGQQSAGGVHQAQYSQQQAVYGGYNQSTGGYNQGNVAVQNNQVSSQVQTVVNNAAAAAAAQTAGQVVNSR